MMMMERILMLVLCWMMVIAGNCYAATDTIYLAATQQGDGSHTSCATAADWATYRDNSAMWAATDTADGLIGPNDAVRFCDDGGVFRGQITLYQSGLSGKNITFEAAENEHPVFSGANVFPADSWTKYPYMPGTPAYGSADTNLKYWDREITNGTLTMTTTGCQTDVCFDTAGTAAGAKVFLQGNFGVGDDDQAGEIETTFWIKVDAVGNMSTTASNILEYLNDDYSSVIAGLSIKIVGSDAVITTDIAGATGDECSATVFPAADNGVWRKITWEFQVADGEGGEYSTLLVDDVQVDSQSTFGGATTKPESMRYGRITKPDDDTSVMSFDDITAIDKDHADPLLSGDRPYKIIVDDSFDYGVWQSAAITAGPDALFYNGAVKLVKSTTNVGHGTGVWNYLSADQTLILTWPNDPDLEPINSEIDEGISYTAYDYAFNFAGKDRIDIDGLELLNYELAGVLFNNTTTSKLSNCNIHDNVVNGIRSLYTNVGIIVVGNTIKNNHQYGVDFASAAGELQIRYNKIISNNIGLYGGAAQTSAIIANNVIAYNWVDGLKINGVAGYTAINNIFEYNGGLAINGLATSALTHSNNSLLRSFGDIVSYNGVSYTAATIGDFEASTIVGNINNHQSEMVGIPTFSFTTPTGIISAFFDGTSAIDLKKSTDGGLTYGDTLQSIGNSATCTGHSALITQDGSYLLSTRGCGDINNNGVYRSIDAGASWALVLPTPSGSVWGMSQGPTGIIHAGFYVDLNPSIYTSTDDGASWIEKVDLSHTARHIHDVAVSPAGTAYATYGDGWYFSTLNDYPGNQHGVIKSTDNWESFTHVYQTLNQQTKIIPLADRTIFASDAGTDGTSIFVAFAGQLEPIMVYRDTKYTWATAAFSDPAGECVYIFNNTGGDALAAYVKALVSCDKGIHWDVLGVFASTAAYDGYSRPQTYYSSSVPTLVRSDAAVAVSNLLNLPYFDSYLLSDAGINDGVPVTGIHDQATPATDLNGTPVLTDPDIGAYEYPGGLYFNSAAADGGNGTKSRPYNTWADYLWTGYNLRAGAEIYLQGAMAGTLDLSGLTDTGKISIKPWPGKKLQTINGFIPNGTDTTLQAGPTFLPQVCFPPF
jgi:hypothetical protein